MLVAKRSKTRHYSNQNHKSVGDYERTFGLMFKWSVFNLEFQKSFRCFNYLNYTLHKIIFFFDITLHLIKLYSTLLCLIFCKFNEASSKLTIEMRNRKCVNLIVLCKQLLGGVLKERWKVFLWASWCWHINRLIDSILERNGSNYKDCNFLPPFYTYF